MNDLINLIDILIDIANSQVATSINFNDLSSQYHAIFESGKLDGLLCVKQILTDNEYQKYLINEYKKIGYWKAN